MVPVLMLLLPLSPSGRAAYIDVRRRGGRWGEACSRAAADRLRSPIKTRIRDCACGCVMWGLHSGGSQCVECLRCRCIKDNKGLLLAQAGKQAGQDRSVVGEVVACRRSRCSSPGARGRSPPPHQRPWRGHSSGTVDRRTGRLGRPIDALIGLDRVSAAAWVFRIQSPSSATGYKLAAVKTSKQHVIRVRHSTQDQRIENNDE